MVERRELRLVENASPCDTNYFDRTLLTVSQAKQRGKEQCTNYNECLNHPRNCALRYGVMVAKYVMKGSNLKSELLEFSEAPQINEKYWDSLNRKEYRLIQGKSKVIKAVEGFARIVLLENPFQSVFDFCPKCEGIKLETIIIDSGRDGVCSLSGSGRTRKRNVAYCPSCEPKPQDGTFEENIIDDLI